MQSKAIPFWRRWDWQRWRRLYLEKVPEAERRAFVRYPGNRDAACRADGSGPAVPARIRNISLGGINLLTAQAIPTGTLLQIEVASPQEQAPRLLSARVLHAIAEPDGQWSLGCVFTQQIGTETLQEMRGNAPQSSGIEHRAAVRRPSDLPVTCWINGSDGQVWPGRLHDISEIGLGLQVGFPFRPGTVLLIELAARGSWGPRRVTAAVVHARPLGPGWWIVGCSLSQPLTAQDLQAVAG